MTVSIIRITPDAPGRPAQVIYLDPAGAQKGMPLRDAVALAPLSWVPTPDTVEPSADANTSDLPVHRLDLTDSQRFVGLLEGPDDASLAGGKPGDAPVLFHSDTLGTLSFPLERVWRYVSDARHVPELAGRPLSTANDTILLHNTDRLEGLVTRLGPTIWIETRPIAPSAGAAPRAREQATQIDADQADLVNLVNPPVTLKTVRIDLSDGSVVAVDLLSADTQTGKVLIHAIDAPASNPDAKELELGVLAGVVPDPSRITPLCTLPIASQTPAPGRSAGEPASVLADARAPLAAADILLPGPMTVEWTLPTGPGAPVSLIGYAQMDDRSFAWGDCTAIVSIAPREGPERELARARLNGENPTLTIAADLGPLGPGDRLRVRTEAGASGSIQDRVVLRRMVLLGK
jgi:hypothetical protein